jgi:hypothetical protein
MRVPRQLGPSPRRVEPLLPSHTSGACLHCPGLWGGTWGRVGPLACCGWVMAPHVTSPTRLVMSPTFHTSSALSSHQGTPPGLTHDQHGTHGPMPCPGPARQCIPCAPLSVPCQQAAVRPGGLDKIPGNQPGLVTGLLPGWYRPCNRVTGWVARGAAGSNWSQGTTAHCVGGDGVSCLIHRDYISLTAGPTTRRWRCWQSGSGSWPSHIRTRTQSHRCPDTIKL